MVLPLLRREQRLEHVVQTCGAVLARGTSLPSAQSARVSKHIETNSNQLKQKTLCVHFSGKSKTYARTRTSGPHQCLRVLCSSVCPLCWQSSVCRPFVPWDREDGCYQPKGPSAQCHRNHLEEGATCHCFSQALPPGPVPVLGTSRPQVQVDKQGDTGTTGDMGYKETDDPTIACGHFK